MIAVLIVRIRASVVLVKIQIGLGVLAIVSSISRPNRKLTNSSHRFFTRWVSSRESCSLRPLLRSSLVSLHLRQPMLMFQGSDWIVGSFKLNHPEVYTLAEYVLAMWQASQGAVY